jgi:hypothetical protein
MSSLNATLHNFFNAAMEGVHTSLPGNIVSYDADTHRATIQPTIRLLRDNGVEIEIPELLDVPVIFPSSASFDIDFPLEKAMEFYYCFQNLIQVFGEIPMVVFLRLALLQNLD